MTNPLRRPAGNSLLLLTLTSCCLFQPAPPPVVPPPSVSQPEGPSSFEITPTQINEVYAETSRVNSNGERHDDHERRCDTAPQNLVWAQATVRENADQRIVKEESRFSCYVDFHDYREVMPGVTEPKTACFNAYVVSVGGVVNIGKKGELWCRFLGSHLNPNHPL
jgi:hypothetical protein